MAGRPSNAVTLPIFTRTGSGTTCWIGISTTVGRPPSPLCPRTHARTASTPKWRVGRSIDSCDATGTICKRRDTLKMDRAAIYCLVVTLSFGRILASAADSAQSNAVLTWESFDFQAKPVTADQLKQMNLTQLKYMRGIVFGKHGRIFKEEALQKWPKTRPRC